MSTTNSTATDTHEINAQIARTVKVAARRIAFDRTGGELARLTDEIIVDSTLAAVAVLAQSWHDAEPTRSFEQCVNCIERALRTAA